MPTVTSSFHPVAQIATIGGMERWDLLKAEAGSTGNSPGAIISAAVLLREREREILLVPKVALYDREEPAVEYQEGSLVVTNHRLLWRNSKATGRSLSLSLSLVSRHVAKAGFLTSSPKVILYLRPKSAQSPAHPVIPLVPLDNNVGDSNNDMVLSPKWVCDICDEENPGEALKCTVCGVVKRKKPPLASAPSFRSVQPAGWSCGICTFENKLERAQCEMCETPRMSPQPPQGSPTPSDISTGSRHAVHSSQGEDAFVKLSFRGGTGTSVFTAHLQTVLQRQDWKSLELELQKIHDGQNPADSLTVGVAALLKRVDLSQKNVDDSLNVAFNDLNSLMDKASDMVKLAESISSKLASKTESVDDAVESAFRKLLLEIGVVGAAVTKEQSGSSFHRELSKQLGTFVVQLLERRKTLMLPLADIYCLYNRSRGANFVSPEDIYRASQLFDQSSAQVALRRLPSGLLVVQRRADDGDQAALARIVEMISADREDVWCSVDALEVSRAQNISLSLALMFLREAESKGLVCRDDSPSGTRYYRNVILSS